MIYFAIGFIAGTIIATAIFAVCVLIAIKKDAVNKFIIKAEGIEPIIPRVNEIMKNGDVQIFDPISPEFEAELKVVEENDKQGKDTTWGGI